MPRAEGMAPGEGDPILCVDSSPEAELQGGESPLVAFLSHKGGVSWCLL